MRTRRSHRRSRGPRTASLLSVCVGLYLGWFAFGLFLIDTSRSSAI